MRKVTCIDIPIYTQQCVIAIGTSVDFLIKYLEEKFRPEWRYLLPDLKTDMQRTLDNKNLRGQFWKHPSLSGFSVIYIPDGRAQKSEILPILVHEITHATLSLGAHIGFTHCFESEEFYTYMNQFLFYEAYMAFWPEREKKK